MIGCNSYFCLYIYAIYIHMYIYIYTYIHMSKYVYIYMFICNICVSILVFMMLGSRFMEKSSKEEVANGT